MHIDVHKTNKTIQRTIAIYLTIIC